jgi:hypothetical protein
VNKQAKIALGLTLIIAGVFTVVVAVKAAPADGGNSGGGSDEPEAFDPSPGGVELEADMPIEELNDDGDVTGDDVPNDVDSILGLSEGAVNG